MGKEWQAVQPEEMIIELNRIIKNQQKNKYAFQVGLKDLDFDVDEDNLQTFGLTLPFQSIDQAEQTLRASTITPTLFLEYDDTEHQVLIFDPRPIGFSGFLDCVTHSLALTNKGMFEVGRYPAINLSAQNRYWQWFLHRRLATSEQVVEWQENQMLSSIQFVDQCYEALING